MNATKVLSIAFLLFLAVIVVFSIYISVTMDANVHDIVRNADLYSADNGHLFVVCNGVLTTLDTDHVPDGHTLRRDSTHPCGWSFGP